MTRDQLLPAEMLRCLPPLYITEHDPVLIAQARFFYPACSWAWYPIEFDGDDLFFGFVDGDAQEFGYFRLSELLETRDALGLPIERDMFFMPTAVDELIGRPLERTVLPVPPSE